jgi:hypothetical protein
MMFPHFGPSGPFADQSVETSSFPPHQLTIQCARKGRNSPHVRIRQAQTLADWWTCLVFTAMLLYLGVQSCQADLSAANLDQSSAASSFWLDEMRLSALSDLIHGSTIGRQVSFVANMDQVPCA